MSIFSGASAMAGSRKRGELIRQFILDNVETHPTDIVKLAGETFEISRQAVNKHIQILIGEKTLRAEGAGRNRKYLLAPTVEWDQTYPLDGNLKEDVVWRKDIAPLLGDLPRNVKDIWQYGFTEMLNNAIDHSAGSQVTVDLSKTVATTVITILDDGEGIFQKIQRELNLEDERHAVLELTKGKLTTDPEHHSGEGIFFSSRMFDKFSILSKRVCFVHQYGQSLDWILKLDHFRSGTGVQMTLRNNTSRTSKEIFDKFASEDDYGFTKTIVPVLLAQYGDEQLISRSQAKRLLARLDKFKVVVLDFSNVETIGQAFADEVFRVFVNDHPDIELRSVNANTSVQQMISRITK
jgi:hypothetical protein